MSQSFLSEMLQFARRPPLIWNGEVPNSCRSWWNTREARFEDCFLPTVFLFPFGLAIIVLAVRVGRPLGAYLPQWMKPFITEPEPAFKRSLNVQQRNVSFQGRILMGLSFTGIVLELIAAMRSGSTARGLLPAAAWVNSHESVFIARGNIADPSLGYHCFTFLR